MCLVHVGGNNWSVQVIVEIDLAIWIRIYRSIRPEMSLGSIRGSLLSSSFSGSSGRACDIHSVMCGEVIGGEGADLIFDGLSCAIDAPFCLVRRQPLLVNGANSSNKGHSTSTRATWASQVFALEPDRLGQTVTFTVPHKVVELRQAPTGPLGALEWSRTVDSSAGGGCDMASLGSARAPIQMLIVAQSTGERRAWSGLKNPSASAGGGGGDESSSSAAAGPAGTDGRVQTQDGFAQLTFCEIETRTRVAGPGASDGSSSLRLRTEVKAGGSGGGVNCYRQILLSGTEPGDGSREWGGAGSRGSEGEVAIGVSGDEDGGRGSGQAQSSSSSSGPGSALSKRPSSSTSSQQGQLQPNLPTKTQHTATEIYRIYGFEEGEDETECMVCYDRRKTALLLPCRHCCVCRHCLRSLRGSSAEKCPLCRTVFSDGYLTFPLKPKVRKR